MSLTTEQKALRLGKFTASTIEKLCKPKGFGDAGLDYIYEKAAETLTGECIDLFVNKSMQWGIDNEPNAIAHFEAVKSVKVKPSDTIVLGELVGTPDGIIEGFGGIEIKCPDSKTHVKYLAMDSGDDLKSVNATYYWQIQAYMLLTGAEKWYFVTYDPRVRVDNKVMGIFTINRNKEDIDLLISRVKLASEILNNLLK